MDPFRPFRTHHGWAIRRLQVVDIPSLCPGAYQTITFKWRTCKFLPGYFHVASFWTMPGGTSGGLTSQSCLKSARRLVVPTNLRRATNWMKENMVTPKKIPKSKIAIKHSSTFLGLLYRNIEHPLAFSGRSHDCRSDFILQPPQVTSMFPNWNVF